MIVTLTTDFGLQDSYVGIVKGIIKTISPQVELIDLTHNIPPQNLYAASFILANGIDYFPRDTIHLIIVDPTVGSDRKIIAVVCEQGYFICPDNGLLTGVLLKYRPKQAYHLTNNQYWLNKQVSKTFHGRDIFAPVTAHLANGISLDDLGEEIAVDDLVTLDLPTMTKEDNTIQGIIQYIDIFGNLITNIPAKLVKNRSWYVQDKSLTIESYTTYNDVSPSELLSLIGSHGYVEIAVNGGNAKMTLNKQYGDIIEVKIN